MNVVSLDKICKNLLLRRNYPIHYYLNFLIPSKDCLRILSMDEAIQTLRYKVLPVNENSAIEIPNDFVDYAQVSVRVGQYLRPLVEDSTLDLVPNYDSNFDIQPYSSGIQSQTSTQQPLLNGYYFPFWFWGVNFDAYGENIGREFGGTSNFSDTFKVNKARNEIKINEDLGATEILLEYIGNGMDADSATHIDAYAQDTIEAYCLFQFYLNNRTYSQAQADDMEQKYIFERLRLRARLSDLNIESLKRVVQRNTSAIKY